MVQTYQDFPASEKIRDSRPKIAARDEALRSCFSGTAFPTEPAPIVGQYCFRTDEKKLYQCREATGPIWVEQPVFMTALTATALRAIDAAAHVPSGGIALLLDTTLDVYQYDPASESAHNGTTVLRPSVGAASTGAGRWLRLLSGSSSASPAMTPVIQADTRVKAGIEEIVVTADPFNAPWNGVDDDAGAIQDAIDYAIGLGRPARVLLPAGLGRLSTKITINPSLTANSQVELVGAGSDATVPRCLTGFSETEIIRFGPGASSTTRVTGGLRGFTVDGNNLAGAGTVAGIYIWNAYRSSFEDLSVDNVTEDGIVSAGHASGVSGDPCNQGNFFLQIYNRNCDGDGLYTRGEKASLFDQIHGDACGGYAFFLDSETVGGNTETTENIVQSVMARNCDAGGMAISGAAKLNLLALHAHICNGPALHIRPTESGTTAPVYYSNIVQVVSRNTRGAVITESGNSAVRLVGTSIGDVVHVGAYPSATNDGFVARGWSDCAIGSITMQSNPGTCVRFADQSGATPNVGIRVGRVLLSSNGDASAADNHGVSIEGASDNIAISHLLAKNSQTNATESSYELRVESGVNGSIRIGECFLDANASGYELSIGDPSKVEFYGSKKIDGASKPIDLIATATNDNALSGRVGEFIESEVLVGSAISLTSGVIANVTSISLPPGDWDVCGNVWLAPAATTQITAFHSAINTDSAQLPTRPGKGGYSANSRGTSTGQVEGLSTGLRRMSISSTTTVYLVTRANFSVDTCSAYGYISARRAR